MRILVTFAVDAEFAPWRKLGRLRSRTAGHLEVFNAEIGRASVDFVVTGMGAGNASRAAEALMSATKYEFCISAGFAGALSEKHRIGDILVAEGVQQLGGSKTLWCSRNLTHAAKGDGAKQVRLFLTSDHVIRTIEEKKRLAAFAGAVDMESFGVACVAEAHGIPVVAIRVISDTTDRDLPARIDTMIDERGRLNLGGVVRGIVRHPLQIPALIRLGRESRRAAEALANFLDAFIGKVSCSLEAGPPAELKEAAAQ